MRYSFISIPSSAWLLLCAACGGPGNSAEARGAGGGAGKGGTLGAAGVNAAAGSVSGGGVSSSGASNGGAVTSSGGTPATGGQLGTAGLQNGGATGGNVSSGGTNADGPSGGMPNGGAGTSGGGTGGAGLPTEPDCNEVMPSSGAVQHSGNGVGGQGNLAWEIWSNTGQGELTSYSVPAFTATWNNAGGYLGRLGYEWGAFGSSPKPFEQHGTISAQFVAKKSGTAGGYSYVGMYGWSTNPCVEWYVVDDSFGNMPINPGMTTNKGEVEIDGGTYIMYTRSTTGSGGTRCSNTTNWVQYYSVRKTARQCGIISLTQHFQAWKSLGMSLGNLLEAKILVEVGGGVGKVDLPIANVIEAP